MLYEKKLVYNDAVYQSLFRQPSGSQFFFPFLLMEIVS